MLKEKSKLKACFHFLKKKKKTQSAQKSEKEEYRVVVSEFRLKSSRIVIQVLGKKLSDPHKSENIKNRKKGGTWVA